MYFSLKKNYIRSMLNSKYTSELNHAFSRAVIKKVNNYFRENHLDRKANRLMIFKSVMAFSFYMGVYFFIISNTVSSLPFLFFLWMLLGLGQAFIGMVIMHDAVHNSYSLKKWVKVLLEVPIILIGVDSKIWKIEHNIIHHNNTNVENVDQDINPRMVFRFSENQPLRWFHRFQSIYASFVYCFLIVEWVTFKDFLKLWKYRKEKYVKSRKELITILLGIVIKKVIFFLVFLIIPIYISEFSIATVVLMFLTMLFTAGLYMTIVFQLAHIVPETLFFSHSGNQNKTWHICQLLSTSNFGMNDKILTFLVGGLNFQIEHHLFPDVCHIHYPKIAPIVQETATEFGLPYQKQSTFIKAIQCHYKHLSTLGKPEVDLAST
jgi:linoleoyl-CoA desaturase